ncbi:hypothetical protein [Thermomonospora sp. CIF 1]|uniref:Uncharacterized protein n=1 Tax=Thermomonospora curvata (strain ATCC 19995 / DSM 43183 / JCM 3096 / KCTC 9072 / NBRC 15933 / NCIMB 10081 / Henssen B9) TaxID=471852 RepID=D1ADD2_THECD|nr:hypothetical protein [Thermomonospora sp. CIF 1]ACY95642.1 hypothetical protein Tcur_0034 [Thermomonospora curvata DSM 43183]
MGVQDDFDLWERELQESAGISWPATGPGGMDDRWPEEEDTGPRPGNGTLGELGGNLDGRGDDSVPESPDKPNPGIDDRFAGLGGRKTDPADPHRPDGEFDDEEDLDARRPGGRAMLAVTGVILLGYLLTLLLGRVPLAVAGLILAGLILLLWRVGL